MTFDITEAIRRNLTAAERIAPPVATEFDRALAAVVERFAALTCPRCGRVGMTVGDHESEPADGLTVGVHKFVARCPLCAWQPGKTVLPEDADSER